MFTSPKYETADMIERHELLRRIAAMVDSGNLRTTLGENLGTINAASLKKAHERVETGRTRGKIVLAGS
jgi:NADPH2:quinone reductase